MRRAFWLVLVLAGTVAAGRSDALAQRSPPHRFFGAVTVAGVQPAAGTTVEAYIDNRLCGGPAQTSSTGQYVIDVEAANARPGCGTADNVITFRVAGVAASQTARFLSGGFDRLDLSTATGGPYTTIGLNLEDPRPCVPEPGTRRCDPEREALWNGDADAWAARGVTDPSERFTQIIILRVRAGDQAVIRNIARILGGPYLQITRLRFVGAEPGQTDEYVEITNLGGGEQDMTGWTMRSPGRDAIYNFPDGFVMAAGQVCRIYTGSPRADSCGGTSWNRTDVWPDAEGEAVLYYDRYDLLGARTLYSADRANQPPYPNLQGVE